MRVSKEAKVAKLTKEATRKMKRAREASSERLTLAVGPEWDTNRPGAILSERG